MGINSKQTKWRTTILAEEMLMKWCVNLLNADRYAFIQALLKVINKQHWEHTERYREREGERCGDEWINITANMQQTP